MLNTVTPLFPLGCTISTAGPKHLGTSIIIANTMLMTSNYRGHIHRSMIHVTKNVMITITTGLVLIPFIWHYLILFIVLLGLVIWNLNFKKGHTEFWGILWFCTAPCTTDPSAGLLGERDVICTRYTGKQRVFYMFKLLCNHLLNFAVYYFHMIQIMHRLPCI